MFLFIWMFLACSANQNNPVEEQETVSQINEDYHVTVTFSEGPLKGKHKFTLEKGNFASSFSGDIYNGNSLIRAKNVRSESNIPLLYFSRDLIDGENLAIGEVATKKYTDGCGKINFNDTENNYSYKEIRGNFFGCSKTTIEAISDWKKGIVNNHRKIKGKFTDVLTMKIKKDDDSKQTISTNVEVSFVVKQLKK